MTSVPITVHVFHPPPEGVPLSSKLDHLVKEFKSLASSQCAAGMTIDGLPANCDRMYFQAASQSLRRLKDELVKKEELAHQKHVEMMLKLEQAEADLKTTSEDRKKLAQELKHSEKERVKAFERARTAEEKIKAISEQGEKDGAELEKAKKRAQQLQRKVDELQRLQRMSPRDDSSDGEKKKGKEHNNNTDVVGLQKGMEKVQTQLKKKQAEYQLQAVSLQQATSKIKNLEAKIAQDKTTIDERNQEIERLTAWREDERKQRNAEVLSQEMEYTKLINSMKAEFSAREAQYKNAYTAVGRQSNLNLERFKRAEEKANRIQVKLTELQNTPVDYSLFGDADIADRIRIRNLIDQTQERLAALVGLKTAPGESLSLCWRLALGPSTDDHVRVLRAQELVADADESKFTEDDRAFLENETAFRLVCQLYSRFRSPGNDVHKLFTHDKYTCSVLRYLEHTPTERAGDSLLAMVNYICSSTPPKRPASI